MAPSADELIRRWQRMLAKRGSVDAMAQDIADFVMPYKAAIIVRTTEGTRMTGKVFDSTAIKSASDLAANMAGVLTSSSQEWFSLTYRQTELNESKEAADWLEDCGRRMYKAFNQSNFHMEMLEQYVDLVVFGTSAIFEDELPPRASGEFAGLRFKTIPFGTYCIEEDGEGQVDTIFYKYELSARVAYAKWKNKAGSKVVTAASGTNGDQMFDFLHAIYPRTDRPAGKRGNLAMAWASCHVALDDKKKVEEGGFEEFPGMTPRWAKTAHHIYGYGPSHTAWPDVRSLNAAKEILLKSAPLAMQPPTAERSDAILGDLDLTPGGRNVVDAAGAIGDSFTFMDTHAHVDISQLVLGDLKSAIQDTFFITQMRLKKSPQMTATEVLELREEMERILGPTAGRLEWELLSRLIGRTFGIMYRARAFGPTPAAVTQWIQQHRDAPDLDVQYEGPLQRSRRQNDILAITRLDAMVASDVAVYPQIVDNIDYDAKIRETAEVLGVPGKIIRGLDVVAQMRQARHQQQQVQQALTQAGQVADALGKAAPGVKVLHQASQASNGTPAAVPA